FSPDACVVSFVPFPMSDPYEIEQALNQLPCLFFQDRADIYGFKHALGLSDCHFSLPRFSGIILLYREFQSNLCCPCSKKS
ncbi:MAG: hypothetical protein AABZ00_11530, partial [Chloroflexota bacterium]